MSGTEPEPLRLHIGGTSVRAGWKILNVQAGPGVDFVGSCVDLSQFRDGSVREIYASHVYEHLAYRTELKPALAEAWRVLEPGGRLMIAVPDLDVLFGMFLDPALQPHEKFYVTRMIYGGQVDAFDFHKCGFNFEILEHYVKQAGFRTLERVTEFGLFADTSTLKYMERSISLNAIATK